MKFIQFTLAAALVVPSFAFAAATETWKLEGVNARNHDRVINAVQKAAAGSTVTLDDSGTLTVSAPSGDVNKTAVARALPREVRAIPVDTSTTTTTSPAAPGSIPNQENSTSPNTAPSNP